MPRLDSKRFCMKVPMQRLLAVAVFLLKNLSSIDELSYRHAGLMILKLNVMKSPSAIGYHCHAELWSKQKVVLLDIRCPSCISCAEEVHIRVVWHFTFQC